MVRPLLLLLGHNIKGIAICCVAIEITWEYYSISLNFHLHVESCMTYKEKAILQLYLGTAKNMRKWRLNGRYNYSFSSSVDTVSLLGV